MYADLGPGQTIDLEPPSQDGVDVLYSHEYVANRMRSRLRRRPTRTERTNLYSYVANDPVEQVDPTGLRPAEIRVVRAYDLEGGQTDESFYVCRRLVNVQGIARKCGCQHTDIYGDQSGEVYQGFGGPVIPSKAGLPQGSGWTCTKLMRADVDFVERPLGRLDLIPKTFRWGLPGKSCKDATSAQILACLQSKPKPYGTPGLISNCQTDVYEAAEGCCLRGLPPLTILPVRGLPPGPKF